MCGESLVRDTGRRAAFVSGCELLISVGSAGQIADLGPPPYYLVIDRALRDEGTSYHYLPPDQFVDADGVLLALADEVLVGTSGRLHRGATWTTDALSAKPRMQSPSGVVAEFWRWRWKPRRSTPSDVPATNRCCASHSHQSAPPR